MFRGGAQFPLKIPGKSFDMRGEFCQATLMPYSTRKFAALLLAIWLPLFSGNALAASVTMLAMSDECPMMAAQINAHQQQSSHYGEQAADQHDVHNTACNDSGVCHFACSGYMATLVFEVMKVLQSVQSYPASTTQFQSCTTTPLDPPPLSRV